MRAKKPKLDEIEKILLNLLGDFNFSNIENKKCAAYPAVAIDPLWLRRKLQALVRKAYYIGQIEWHERHDTVNWTENLKDRRFVKLFGVKP